MNSKQAEAARLKLEQLEWQCQELRERAAKAEAERDALADYVEEFKRAYGDLKKTNPERLVAIGDLLIHGSPNTSLAQRDARTAYETIAAMTFPTMLRKMWSGGEVQEWLKDEAEKYRQQAERGSHRHVPESLAQTITSDDASQIMVALSELAQDKGGITQLANKTGLARGNLYRILSEDGNPTLSTLLEILDALDLQLKVSSKHVEGDA